MKAKIDEVYDRAGAADYLGKNSLGFMADHAQIDSFNRKLLEETMEVRNDCLDGLDGLEYRRGGSEDYIC